LPRTSARDAVKSAGIERRTARKISQKQPLRPIVAVVLAFKRLRYLASCWATEFSMNQL
jgi:hypothetical protein